MLDIRDAVIERLAGKHGAVDLAMRLETALLQPAQIKHSIVCDPVAITVLKELVNTLPLIISCVEQIDNNDRLGDTAAKLQQPQLALLWL